MLQKSWSPFDTTNSSNTYSQSLMFIFSKKMKTRLLVLQKWTTFLVVSSNRFNSCVFSPSLQFLVIRCVVSVFVFVGCYANIHSVITSRTNRHSKNVFQHYHVYGCANVLKRLRRVRFPVNATCYVISWLMNFGIFTIYN